MSTGAVRPTDVTTRFDAVQVSTMQATMATAAAQYHGFV
jgi:hypothetical protein